MVLLLLDNVAAFYWQCKKQPIGYAGTATGLYSKERNGVGSGVLQEVDHKSQQLSSDRDNTWFIELLTHRIRYLLQKYHMVGVVSKPTVMPKQVRERNQRARRQDDNTAVCYWASDLSYILFVLFPLLLDC